MSADPTTKRRATSLGPHDIFLLDQWGRQLYEAFGECPYLVGSVARAEEKWRDVDVRLPIEDEVWPAFAEPNMRLHALNLAITLWGQHVTGLPIDFQFQSLSQFQAEDGIVNPLGPRSKTQWRRPVTKEATGG